MPKNIVILLDGTSNEIKTNRSNILRLYGTLEKNEDQLVYYDPGVGTIGADGAWLRFWRKTVEIWGMLTGWGLDQNVKEAYRFLVENYDAGDGADIGPDRIYIFGFSRGAYTARVLAGFLHAFGLLEARNLNLLNYAFRAYKRIGEAENTFEEIRLYERILRPSRPIVRCLGLFDTVASVIEQGRFLPRLRNHAFTESNPSVAVIRHAVALNERRSMFRPQLWPEDKLFQKDRFNKKSAIQQDVREVWFSGVHGDVGGGYAEAESGLAKIPLHWMIEQTKVEGLRFKTRTINELVLGKRKDRDYVAPDPMAAAHDSMTWAWRVLEYIPRLHRGTTSRASLLGFFIPGEEARAVPDEARVHASVLERQHTGIAAGNLPTSIRTEGKAKKTQLSKSVDV